MSRKCRPSQQRARIRKGRDTLYHAPFSPRTSTASSSILDLHLTATYNRQGSRTPSNGQQPRLSLCAVQPRGYTAAALPRCHNVVAIRSPRQHLPPVGWLLSARIPSRSSPVARFDYVALTINRMQKRRVNDQEMPRINDAGHETNVLMGKD